MSNRIQAKQIEYLQSAFVGTTITATAAASDVVTADITALASTAARGGSSVPVQVASATQEGFVTSGADNRVLIRSADGGAVESPDLTEVYGRLVEAAGAYTLEYYYLNSAGTETAFTMAAGDVTAFFPYTFDLKNLPSSALLRTSISDVAGASSVSLVEVLITPTAQNTLPNLPITPAAGEFVHYTVNGKGEDELAGGAISRTGNALTWSAANASYDVETTDRVTAIYVA